MRKTDFIMGTAVVIDIPGLKDGKIIDAAFAQLRAVDEQFSPYKKTSELYQFNKKRLTPGNVSIGMKDVMKVCLGAENFTGGYFSARYGDEFDPSGYVKGWAVSEVKFSLLNQGFKTFCVSAGGDMTAKSAGTKVWRIGIQHPLKKNEVLGTIIGKNIAVATSGSTERGHHVINPKTGQPARDFLSLTVAGPDIVKADVMATAAFAMGMPGLDFVDKQREYEVLAVDPKGKIYLSGGMANMLESDLTITGEVV
jgi:thiamine biosynthesis lipoprotein